MSRQKKAVGIVERRVLETRKGFNKKRWQELFDNPPKSLQDPINNETFRVDPDAFRKYLQYVYDMVHKTLDVFGLFGGIEGSGKSTDASQVGYEFYFIMCECNVLREDLGTWYEWTDKNCLGHNLDAFLDLCDKYNDDLWRIIICDEAGDLKSEDRWEDANKMFRDEMRKDRKKLRVRLLCYPQPFELVKDFTMGRTNFIRINRFSLEKDGMGSIPDVVDMIIIPRGDYTYSFITKELVPRGQIKGALKEVSKERYTSEFPRKFIFKTMKKDNVFCFDAEEYIKRAKEENRLRKKQEKVYLSNNLIELIANHLTAGKMGFSTKKPDESLTRDERQQVEEERRKAFLISKLINTCRERLKKIEEKANK